MEPKTTATPPRLLVVVKGHSTTTILAELCKVTHPQLCKPGAIRYAEDKRKAKEQYEAIGKLLDAQCESNRQRNAEEVAQQQEEIDGLKARWAADDAAARQAEVSARARQQQLNVEVKEFNRCNSHHRIPAKTIYLMIWLATMSWETTQSVVVLSSL